MDPVFYNYDIALFRNCRHPKITSSYRMLQQNVLKMQHIFYLFRFFVQSIFWLCNEYLDRDTVCYLHFANGNLFDVWPLFTIFTGINYAVCCLRSTFEKLPPKLTEEFISLEIYMISDQLQVADNQISNTVKLLFLTTRNVVSWFYTSTWHVVIICCTGWPKSKFLISNGFI